MATIKEIKTQLLSVYTPDDPLLVELSEDPRTGVQRLIKHKQKEINQLRLKEEAFQARFTLERELWSNGIDLVAGIDEVGRGCLAGPVVTASVVLDETFDLIDVNDSKQLSSELREELYAKILTEAVSVGIGVCSNQKIDEVNILNATKLAMREAVGNLNVTPQHLLIDAVNAPIEIPKTVMFKGDSKSISIAAASIVAKVYRDHLMRSYAALYPGYGFDKNVGYGTKQHIEGLKTYGVTPIHRQTFEPVPEFLIK